MVLGIVARALHVLGKSSFMVLCSMVVLITCFLGIVVSQTATDIAEVGENRCCGSGHNLHYLFCPRSSCLFLWGMGVCWVQWSFRICAFWL